MKKKNSYFLVLASCVLYSTNINASNYYPLGLNNSWNYTNDYFPHTEKIVDTITINEHLYYGLAMWSGEEVACWIRSDNNKIYIYNERDSIEYTLFNFNAEIGESWELNDYSGEFGSKITLTSKNDTITTPAGYFICYRFEHQLVCWDAGILESWFAENIGKVRFTSENYVGLLDSKLNSYTIPTSIIELKPKVIINSFQLYQNYPNPFNAETIIKIFVHRESMVSLSTYDIRGRFIENLVDQRLDRGDYLYKWNAKNQSSGLYIYQMKTEDGLKVRKCLLIK